MKFLYSLDWNVLIFVPIFLALYLAYLFRMGQIGRYISTSWGVITFKLLLRAAYIGLIFIAILGPSFGETKKEIQSVGKDIMIAVDLSRSMDAMDIQPSRLQKTKFELKRIADAFGGDRIGLVIFSSSAYMQCPLTYDGSALNLFIETLSTDLVPNSGTDFGPPLRMSLDKLMEDSEPGTGTRSKIILLISDGEDFGDNTSEIANEIQTNGISLYTLGVGTEEGARVPTPRGFLVDKQGQFVISKLMPGDLKSLAQNSGGEYYEISGARNDVSRLINTIASIEGEVRDVRQVDTESNKYIYFLGLALALIALDMMLNLKAVRV
ncbi:VWA domain-containing protein [Roseivirga sp. BDSF3-8]|uniref:vWA domain-containing protein n=1 Tax=Roseivirga sp. BDSF3-8 TaxID=3241598 RepID=UPI0035319003